LQTPFGNSLMKKTLRNKHYILNYVFLGCLILLFLNDHIFKYVCAGWLTGKLSDAVGIVLLPLLFAFLCPGLRRYAVMLSGCLFVFWKSPYSQGLIDFYNAHSFMPTSRVVDITDLYVLLLLPFPHYIIGQIDKLYSLHIDRIHPMVVLLPTIVTLLATSPPPAHYMMRSNGNLRCYKCSITVRDDQDDMVTRLTQAGIALKKVGPIENGPDWLAAQQATAYRAGEVIIEKDTFRMLDITMRTVKPGKTEIYFAGMQVADSIPDERLQAELRRHYEKLLFSAMKGALKK
jgi:hypothetical protein